MSHSILSAPLVVFTLSSGDDSPVVADAEVTLACDSNCLADGEIDLVYESKFVAGAQVAVAYDRQRDILAFAVVDDANQGVDIDGADLVVFSPLQDPDDFAELLSATFGDFDGPLLEKVITDMLNDLPTATMVNDDELALAAFDFARKSTRAQRRRDYFRCRRNHADLLSREPMLEEQEEQLSPRGRRQRRRAERYAMRATLDRSLERYFAAQVGQAFEPQLLAA